MTYEVHFKLRDAEYTVRGPDTAGILALIDGLEPKGTPDPIVPALGEMYAELMAERATPLPKIEEPTGTWIMWSGGQMPVEAGTRVRYRTRNNYEGVQLAEAIAWDHQTTPRTRDIVAYKVVAPCA